MKLTELLREIYLSSKCNCGCNSCSTTPTLTESKTPISENLQYHINKGIMLSENEFRIGSKAYMQLFKEARSLYKEGKLEVGSLDKALLETDLGEFGDYSEEIEYGSIIQIDPNEFPSFEFPFGTQGEIIGIDNDYMTDNHTYTVKIKYIDGQGDIATELITDGVNGFIFETQKVPLDLPMLNEFNIRDEVKIGMKVLHDGDIFKIIGITPLSIELEEQAYSPMPNLIFPDDFGRDANIEDIWQYFEIYTDYDDTMVEAEYQGKDVPLGKPKRGGSKAYYVYVKDGDKVKKVSFGSGGLRAKIKNKEARNAFAKRHNCAQKKDRTTAGYWSCNLPRYAKALGLGSNMNTFW